MTITYADIFTFIKNFRMSPSLANNATANSDPRGRACVGSAFSWASRGFQANGRDAEWTTAKAAIFNLDYADLSDSTGLVLDTKLTARQVLILEAIIQWSIYEIYALGSMSESADDKRTVAEDMLVSLVGQSALKAKDVGTGGKGAGQTNIQPTCIQGTVETEAERAVVNGNAYLKIY